MDGERKSTADTKNALQKLEKDSHFGDGVVVVGVECGSGDLHTAGEDEK
jgi:hypothetical protein